MGWLLTIFLALPQVDGPVRVEMWFSREGYCTFAQEKFTERPMYRVLENGSDRAPVTVARSTCRELGPEEAHYVPSHMRHILEPTPEADLGGF